MSSIPGRGKTCTWSALPPGQGVGLPASGGAAVSGGIGRTLEPVGDVEYVREPGGAGGLGGGHTARAAAADEIDRVVGGQAGVTQIVLEGRVALHRRINLPGDQ